MRRTIPPLTITDIFRRVAVLMTTLLKMFPPHPAINGCLYHSSSLKIRESRRKQERWLEMTDNSEEAVLPDKAGLPHI